MPTTLQAALLGVLQGLTEFLPVSSTAHLLLGERLSGFQDPGGVFTVMIQLGSILAVMWLYRAKIIDIVAGLPVAIRTRGVSLVRSSWPPFRRLSPARSARRLRQERAVRESIGVRRDVHRRRPRDAGRRAVRARRLSFRTPSTRPLSRAFGDRPVPDAGAHPGRVALGRDDRRRDGHGPRPAGGRGVLVLSRDADDGRGVRARAARGAASALAGPRCSRSASASSRPSSRRWS